MKLLQIIFNIIPFVMGLNESLYDYHTNYINEMNEKNLTFKLEENHFIGREFINMNEFIKNDECHNCFTSSKKVPKSVDWRRNNAVTIVKNQGDCGSCWSFSSTGSIEGINAIKNNVLLNVSEQQLVDCSVKYGNKGCDGGLMDYAFKYVIDDGLCSEEQYPYTGQQDFCKSIQCKTIVRINDYSDIQPNREDVLKVAVAQQPVSVAIQANLTSFKFYKSGIYQDPDCGNQLDHGVLIVGYGYDSNYDLDYWIVKNSWSEEWGENGYVKILRNYEQNPSGMCGIALQPSIPLID